MARRFRTRAGALERCVRSMAHRQGQQVHTAKNASGEDLAAGIRERGVERRSVSGCAAGVRTVEAARKDSFYLFQRKRACTNVAFWEHASAGINKNRSEEHTSELQSRQYLVC